MTISGGIATYPDDATTGMELFDCADKALDRAKRQGRNAVLLHCSERRRAERLEIAVPLTVSKLDRKPFIMPPLRSINLSSTGILSESRGALDVGSLVEMDFLLEETKFFPPWEGGKNRKEPPGII